MMEETSERTPSAEPNKGKTYRNLLIVTVIYLVAFYAVTMTTTTCPTEFIADIRWLRYPQCTTFGPNELGDTLAGAFAPLAFLWLAGAVYIQSQELQEQRRELTETRDVMKAQLALTEEQVKETRASTGYFAEQTAILKRQQELREQEIADEEFDSAAAAICTFVRNSSNFKNITIKEAVSHPLRRDDGDNETTLQAETGTVRDETRSERTRSYSIISNSSLSSVQAIFSDIIRHRYFFEKFTDESKIIYMDGGDANSLQDALLSFMVLASALSKITERTSAAKKHEIQSLDFQFLFAAINEFNDGITRLQTAHHERIMAGWTRPEWKEIGSIT